MAHKSLLIPMSPMRYVPALFASAATVVAFACGGAVVAQKAPCDDLFEVDAKLAACEGTPPYPAADVARVRPQFEEYCATFEALPGSGLDDAAIEACAAAMAVYTCGEEVPAACSALAGHLAGGATCQNAVQCASGSCNTTPGLYGGGATGLGVCGTCLTALSEGMPCGVDSSAICAPGLACKTSTQTCAPITQASAGQPCDGNTIVCSGTLVCTGSPASCQPASTAGAACNQAGDCAWPLTCTAGACVSAVAVGEPCTAETLCARGALCDPSTLKCAEVTWAEPGEPCGATSRCVVGVCNPSAPPSTTTPVCPKIVPNGKPCPTDGSSTCDLYSQCIDGVCAIPGAALCSCADAGPQGC